MVQREFGGGRLVARLALLVGVMLATVAQAQPLERQLSDLMARTKLGKAEVAICVADGSTGDLLAGINENRAMIPASNLKVLTSGAALLTLGKDFDFRTRFVLDGDRLVVIGSGDPGFADPELLTDMKLSVGAFVDRLVASIQSAGAKGLREVVIDDRIFDRELVHPSWPTEQLNRWYCAEVHGVNFHANVLRVFATGAARAGQPAQIRTEPNAGWIELQSSVQTVATGSSAVALFRDGTSGFRFRSTGSVRSVAMDPIEVTVFEPGIMLGRLLADRLTAAGLNAGDVKVRLAEGGEQFDESRVAAVVRTPLATVLKRCNADSHNLYAEALLKRIGHEVSHQPGSWSNGAAVVRMLVSEKLGGDPGPLVIADGAGLSRDNRVNAKLIASWLAAVARSDAEMGTMFIDSMATPGAGSWANRFRDLAKLQSEFRGKSGFINDVLCLSGFLTHPGTGRRITFSILVNRTGDAPPGSVREFQEAVVTRLDRWLVGAGGGRPAAGG